METFLKIAGGVVVVSLAMVILMPLATAAGAATGWVVGLLFGDTILGIFAAMGLHGFAMWQIGAFLGFVGSFFKSFSTKTSSST